MVRESVGKGGEEIGEYGAEIPLVGVVPRQFVACDCLELAGQPSQAILIQGRWVLGAAASSPVLDGHDHGVWSTW